MIGGVVLAKAKATKPTLNLNKGDELNMGIRITIKYKNGKSEDIGLCYKDFYEVDEEAKQFRISKIYFGLYSTDTYNLADIETITEDDKTIYNIK